MSLLPCPRTKANATLCQEYWLLLFCWWTSPVNLHESPTAMSRVHDVQLQSIIQSIIHHVCPAYLSHAFNQVLSGLQETQAKTSGGASQETSGEPVLHYNWERKGFELINVEQPKKKHALMKHMRGYTFISLFDQSTKPRQFPKPILSGPLPRLLHLSVLHLSQILLQIWSLN